MKKQVLSFDEFIYESNNFLQEEESKPKIAKLPDSVKYSSKPSKKELKKGNFYVDFGLDGELTIRYDRSESESATLEFNKKKKSNQKKEEGFVFNGLRRFQSGEITNPVDKAELNPKAKAGIILYDFVGNCGQFGDEAFKIIPLICEVLRILDVGKDYNGKTPDSFKDFMTGLYNNYEAKEILKGADKTTNKFESVSKSLMSGMQKAIKEYPKA